MIKHVSGGSTGYDIFALATIKDNCELTKKVLIDNFGVSEANADLFITIAIDSNENKLSKAISRLPNGGMSSYVSQMACLLSAIPDSHREISYCKILKPYWNNILNVSSVIDDDNLNEYESDLAVEY